MRQFFACIFFIALLAFPSRGVAHDIQLVSNTLPPLKFQKNGRIQGISVDIVTKILREMDHPIKPSEIQTMAWARAYEDALTIPGTILLSMAMTEDRKPFFKWVGPIYTLQLGLIGKIDRNFDIETAADAAKYEVGTLLSTAPEQLLFKQGYPAIKAYRIPKTEQALRMLDDDRIDLFAHTADSSFFMMPQLDIDPTKYKVYYVIKDVSLYIGLNRDFSDDFVAKMQAALDALKQPGPSDISEYQRIVKRYVPYRP